MMDNMSFAFKDLENWGTEQNVKCYNYNDKTKL